MKIKQQARSSGQSHAWLVFARVKSQQQHYLRSPQFFEVNVEVVHFWNEILWVLTISCRQLPTFQRNLLPPTFTFVTLKHSKPPMNPYSYILITVILSKTSVPWHKHQTNDCVYYSLTGDTVTQTCLPSVSWHTAMSQGLKIYICLDKVTKPTNAYSINMHLLALLPYLVTLMYGHGIFKTD